MNNNSKKGIFSKKNIIIFSCIFIVIVGVCFLIFGLENEKVMKCSMSIDDSDYANLDIDMSVHYADKVNSVDGVIYLDVTNETIKKKIDELEVTLRNYYEKSLKTEAITINVSREDFKIILDYDIDYTSIESGDIESFDLFPVDETYQTLTKEEFKNQIIESGGSCVEE